MTDQDRLIAGRYRLGETAGVGAMGIVWRARDERLRRTVAVKQLLPRPGFDQPLTEYARLRAMREARIAARLQHPNVVTVFDVVEEDSQPWLIMEYVPSRSLALVLREFGPMKPYEVADIGAQVASGLAAAHAVGVVHRDIKPGNVLLGDDGTVKITDFGISRSVDDVVATATGLVTGTPAYLAPEVAKGMVPQPTSDVYALGSTLYAALEGMPPFGLSENPLSLLAAVAEGKVNPPANGGPLTPLLMAMLRRIPGDRPTMREVHAELTEIVAQRTVMSRRPIPNPAQSWTKPVVEPVSAPVSVPVSAPIAWPSSQPDPDMAFAPASIVGTPTGRLAAQSGGRGTPSGGLASPRDLADDLMAIHDAAMPQRPQTVRHRLRSVHEARPGRRLRTAMVVVIALIAVGTAVFVVDRAGKGNPQAGPTGGASSTVTGPPTLAAGPPTFTAMSNLVTKYYGLLPGDVNDAWMLLSTQYRSKVTFDQYRAFYNTIAQVVPNNFQQVGPNSITAVINFVTRKGATTHEPYRFTIVNQGGLLIIDDAVMANHATTKLMSG
ncbi:MAG TPA: protein kinase [Pseudonocardiaceae bacterium]|nr:protein kinase [Pseudonocardiaceae bacterium]